MIGPDQGRLGRRRRCDWLDNSRVCASSV